LSLIRGSEWRGLKNALAPCPSGQQTTQYLGDFRNTQYGQTGDYIAINASKKGRLLTKSVFILNLVMLNNNISTTLVVT